MNSSLRTVWPMEICDPSGLRENPEHGKRPRHLRGHGTRDDDGN